MNCLITGGAGFIGGHLAESLLQDGHKVIVIDNLSTGNIDNISDMLMNKNFTFVRGDILYEDIDKYVERSDIIFHLAAAVGVELVVHDPVRTIETNVHGTEKVLNSASKHGIKILTTSTSEVYGKSDKEVFSEEDDLLIGAPMRSRWSYASSKLLDEFLCMAYHKQLKLPSIVVRLFNTVGPGQTGQYGMVIPRFVRQALNNEPITVYGDGTQSRCFCHVFDTVRALRGLAEAPQAVGNVFNIGSTAAITINELANLIIKTLDSKSSIEYIPYEEAYEAGFEDMKHRKPDVSKIKRLLNWEAEISLEEIILDVAKYISQNKKHKNNS